ncbi:MAG: penicillin-binding protein activator, partial [Deltaproteobacteria bacterium]|nr:penicillin-binding protein activator [Deltaproteobacteria bacterium]
KWYGRLLSAHPRSVLAPEARVGLLAAYLAAESPQTLLRRAREFLKEAGSDEERSRILRLAARAHLALDEPVPAFLRFGEAARLAPEPLARDIAGQMTALAGEMTNEELAEAGSRAVGCTAGGVFAVEAAKRGLEVKQYKETGELLEAFMERCEGHFMAREAAETMKRLQDVTRFEPGLLGCLVPLSGPYASLGEAVLAGVEMAVAEHNEKDPEHPVTLLVEDSKADPEAASAGLLTLADEGVALVVGPLAAAGSVADLARELEIPTVVFTQKDLALSEEGYLFRNYLTPLLQAGTLAEYCTRALGLKRFAILHPDDDYGNTYMSRFFEQVVLRGGIVTGVEAYSPGETDLAGPIKRLVGTYYDRPKSRALTLWEKTLKASFSVVEEAEAAEEPPEEEEEKPEAIVDFDALFIPDVPQQAGLILPQLPFHDVTGAMVVGTNLWHSPTLVDIAGRYGRGAVCTDVFYPDSGDPAVARFVRRFRKAWGRKPGALEALGYDTAGLALKAMARPGVDSRPALRRALVDMEPYHGITGETSFSPTGEAEKTLYLLKATARGFEQLR